MLLSLCSLFILIDLPPDIHSMIAGIVVGSRPVRHSDCSVLWRHRLCARQHRPGTPERCAGDDACVEAQEIWSLPCDGPQSRHVWLACSGLLPVRSSTSNCDSSVPQNSVVICLHQQVLRSSWPYPFTLLTDVKSLICYNISYLVFDLIRAEVVHDKILLSRFFIHNKISKHMSGKILSNK